MIDRAKRFALIAALLPIGSDAAELVDAVRDGEVIGPGLLTKEQLAAVHPDGMTALLWATYHDDVVLMGRLIAAGASVEDRNEYGVSPMSLACQNGSADAVELLLEHAADPNDELEGGESVLMTASRNGRVDCVRLLVEAGAKLDAKERNGQTAVMWAAAAGHADVVDLLVESGAEFRAHLNSGYTPLLFAVRQGHAEVVEVLIKAGADVGEGSKPARSNGRWMRAGTSPLVLAIENGHFELAVDLLEAGAEPNDLRSGFAPLHAVSWVRRTPRGDSYAGNPPPVGEGELDSLGFVRELVAQGADVNLRVEKRSGGKAQVNVMGATPFFMAAATGDLEFQKLLIELGADPTMTNADGSPPILVAAGLGVDAPGEEPGNIEDSIKTVDYLLELGADINVVDKRGETVMHGAAYKSAPAMIRHLDSKGADIDVWNRKNKNGWTPLLITQGYRFGNFRPIATTEKALVEVMKAHGAETPAPPKEK